MLKLLPSILILVGLVVLLFVENYLSLSLGLNRSIDFSIFQQALKEILIDFEFNPYVSVRGLNIFNDHFSPILFFGAGWASVFGVSIKSIVSLEAISFFSLLISIVIYFRKKGGSAYLFLIFFALIILSRGILFGLRYPIHPQTWVLLPIFWLGYSIANKKNEHILLYSISLMFFKEIFIPISLLAVVIFSSKEKRIRNILGVSLYICVFILITTSFFQESNIYFQLMYNKVQVLASGGSKSLKLFESVSVNIVSLLIMSSVLLKLWIAKNIKTFYFLLLSITYYFCIHLLTGDGVLNHYAPAFSALAIGLFFTLNVKEVHWKLVCICLLISVYQSVPVYWNILSNLNKYSLEVKIDKRKQELLKVDRMFSKLDPGVRAIMSNELAPLFLSRLDNISTFYFSDSIRGNYQVLILDKTSAFLKELKTDKIVNNCLGIEVNGIYDGSSIYMIEGNIPSACFLVKK